MDWGIFWNAASAIATVAATVLALWLALRDNVKRLDALFVWNQIELYQPILFLHNSGNIPIAIEHIRVTYKNEEIFTLDVLKGYKHEKFDDFLVPPGELRRINLSTEGVAVTKRYKWTAKRKHFEPRIKITIKDIRGKKYVVRQRMSENQMAENEVGAVLLADDRKKG